MSHKSRVANRPKTKLLPVAHTGRLRTHSHTSYGGLVMILLLAMLPIVFSQKIVNADDPVGISAVVAAALPTSAPQIQGIPDGKVLTSNDSLTVTGSCQAKTVVKIFKNHVLAGAANCKGGSYSVPIDLFIGTNSLTARAYNADNIPGPESSPITVKLQPSVNTITAANPANQFYLTSDAFLPRCQCRAFAAMAFDYRRWSSTIPDRDQLGRRQDRKGGTRPSRTVHDCPYI